jgi:hypothetical protein
MKKQLFEGDVYKLELTKGFGGIQCVKLGSNKTEVDIIRIIPGIYYDDDSLIEAVSKPETLFFNPSPFRYSRRDKCFHYLGNYPIPEGCAAPKFFRTKEVIRGQFRCWYIIERETCMRKSVDVLTEEQKELSPNACISIPDIIERIETNWTPRNWN